MARGTAHGLSCPAELSRAVCAPASRSVLLGACKTAPQPRAGQQGSCPLLYMFFWGQMLKIWVGGSLGLWGQLGKRPGRSWPRRPQIREEGRSGRGRKGPREGTGQRVWRRGRGGSRSTAATRAGQRGSAVARLCTPGLPPQPWLLPFFPVPPGYHCSKTGLGSRLLRPCLESAGTQGARLGPGPGSHPIGLS